MNFVVLTGMSGAGKSSAANMLEDLGYYCVDNMPVALIPPFVELYKNMPGKDTDVAFIIDVRGEIEFTSLLDELDKLNENGYHSKVIFIDCDSKTLINRYKETRRIHPLTVLKNITMQEAIDRERDMLKVVKDRADYVIETSALKPAQLKEKINAIFKPGTESSMFISCLSFGFKYGAPTDADLVFDVRCFPNPYYIPELKFQTGLDAPVEEYVFSFPQTNEFMQKLKDMIDFLIPMYIEEGKTQLTVAIGCTGGKHRSVAIAEKLGNYLKNKNQNVVISHRDYKK